MARPQKTGLDYFPFDVDFFSDKKIRRLRAKYGNDGVTAYIYILCLIYRDKGYYAEYDDDLILDISDELNISEVYLHGVCIGSSTDDAWAGPRGEYATARLASPAWELYGRKGLVSDGFPVPNAPQQDGFLSYHIRAGGHALADYDWSVYLDFADKRMRP